jgi:hypothetical protein
MNGPVVTITANPEGELAQLMQWAFRRATDESGWIEDEGQAYLIYAAGFVNAIQLIAEQHPLAAGAVRQAVAMLDDEP